MSYLIKYNFLIDVLKTIFNKQQYYDAMQNFNDLHHKISTLNYLYNESLIFHEQNFDQ